MSFFKSEKGAIPLMVLVAVVGLSAFVLLSSVGSFKDRLFGSLFPKNASKAAFIGVPDIRPNYSQDVENWWDNHPFNPDGANYDPVITPPSNVTTLNSGDSLQLAIDNLDATAGGTIKLNPGNYNGFNLVGKNNVYIIADQAGVVVHGAVKLLGCQEADNYASFNLAVQQNNQTALNCFVNRAKNIYFKNFTLDGGATSASDTSAPPVAIEGGTVRNVVFDGITMQNYQDKYDDFGHRGLISLHAGLDNIWCLNCHFVSWERWATYWDGCQACGVVNSTVESHFGSGAFLFLTNDDFSYDLNHDNNISRDESRDAQYDIVYKNRVNGYVYRFVSMSGADNLVKNNNIGSTYAFGEFAGRASQKNIGQNNGLKCDGTACYVHYNNKVIGNTIGGIVSDGAFGFFYVDGFRGTLGLTGAQNPNQTQWGKTGRYLLANNTITSAPSTFKLLNEVQPLDGPSVVCGNLVNGVLSLENTSNPCPLPTPTPAPTITPTPTPSPLPSPTTGTQGDQTIDFNNFPLVNNTDTPMNGQYPTGVIDWGTNVWQVSPPWQALTTKSFAFKGPSIKTGTMTFVVPTQVKAIDIYDNTGTSSSTVTLSCPGQTTKTVTVTSGQLLTGYQTGWTGTCTNMTISTSNGWDTNFDNLVINTGGVRPTPTPTPAITPTPSPTPLAGDGLRGNYYNTPNLVGNIILTRIDPAINFNWGGTSPTTSINKDNFSIRWTGFLLPPATGQYTIYANTNDGERVYLNNQLIIQDWIDHAARESSKVVSLTGGVRVPITMEYYDSGGNALAELRWSGPGIAKQIIPQTNLFSQ